LSYCEKILFALLHNESDSIVTFLTWFQSGCQEKDPAPNTYRGSILHRAGLQREFLTAT